MARHPGFSGEFARIFTGDNGTGKQGERGTGRERLLSRCGFQAPHRPSHCGHGSHPSRPFGLQGLVISIPIADTPVPISPGVIWSRLRRVKSPVHTLGVLSPGIGSLSVLSVICLNFPCWVDFIAEITRILNGGRLGCNGAEENATKRLQISRSSAVQFVGGYGEPNSLFSGGCVHVSVRRFCIEELVGKGFEEKLAARDTCIGS